MHTHTHIHTQQIPPNLWDISPLQKPSFAEGFPEGSRCQGPTASWLLPSLCALPPPMSPSSPNSLFEPKNYGSASDLSNLTCLPFLFQCILIFLGVEEESSRDHLILIQTAVEFTKFEEHGSTPPASAPSQFKGNKHPPQSSHQRCQIVASVTEHTYEFLSSRLNISDATTPTEAITERTDSPGLPGFQTWLASKERQREVTGEVT